MSPKSVSERMDAQLVEPDQEDPSSHASPNVQNSPINQTNIPPLSIDALKQCIEWWAQYGAQITQDHSPQNPSQNPSLPLQEVEGVESQEKEHFTQSKGNEERFTKELPMPRGEAKLVDRGSQSEVNEATIATEWVKKIKHTFEDTMLDEETKTIVVMRLVEKGAKSWWESLK